MQDIAGSMGGVSMGLQYLDNDKCDLDLQLPSHVRERFTSDASGEDVVSQLRSALNEALQLKNTKVESNIGPPLGANGGSDVAATEMSVKCLCRSATSTSADSQGQAHASASESQDNVSCLPSMSSPVPRKLIPAMKGSREKAGLPLRRLGVSWAPDVYDPPPSSVSHLPKKNNPQYIRNNKKQGKGKNKGKSSRGSSSSKKDKKHHREESSPRSMDSIAVADTEKKFAVDPVAVAGTEKIKSSNYKSTVELLDFDNDVDSPDSNCGSSFLRKSRATLHFPYAETT